MWILCKWFFLFWAGYSALSFLNSSDCGVDQLMEGFTVYRDHAEVSAVILCSVLSCFAYAVYCLFVSNPPSRRIWVARIPGSETLVQVGDSWRVLHPYWCHDFYRHWSVPYNIWFVCLLMCRLMLVSKTSAMDGVALRNSWGYNTAHDPIEPL